MELRSTADTTENRSSNPEEPGGLMFARFEGPREEAVAIALDLCREVLPRLDPVQIESRASLAHGLSLWTACDRGSVVGFKIGHAGGPGSFFSWLGGLGPNSGDAGWPPDSCGCSTATCARKASISSKRARGRTTPR